VKTREGKVWSDTGSCWRGSRLTYGGLGLRCGALKLRNACSSLLDCFCSHKTAELVIASILSTRLREKGRLDLTPASAS
jgi:hypothetical protein